MYPGGDEVKALQTGQVSTAGLVGAGPTGCELAEACTVRILREKGCGKVKYLGGRSLMRPTPK